MRLKYKSPTAGNIGIVRDCGRCQFIGNFTNYD